MKISAALSVLALGLAEAKLQEAEQLEKTFVRALGQEGQRELWWGGGGGDCCTLVCPDEPEPCVYRSKAMMMGGSYYDDDGNDCGYRSKAMMRRTKETPQQGERALPGKGWGGGWPDLPSDGCHWDCECEEPEWPEWPGHGYMCFPTMTAPDDCECTCCGFIPPPIIEEPEIIEPCVYRSKAMMMGGSYYDDDGNDCGYSGSMMGGSMRRTKETPQQGERALPGKGWGGGWGGPSITCDCACDEPEPPRSKNMMGGSMGGSMMGGSYY